MTSENAEVFRAFEFTFLKVFFCEFIAQATLNTWMLQAGVATRSGNRPPALITHVVIDAAANGLDRES